MKTKTNVKAGGWNQHNETLRGLPLRTNVRGGRHEDQSQRVSRWRVQAEDARQGWKTALKRPLRAGCRIRPGDTIRSRRAPSIVPPLLS